MSNQQTHEFSAQILTMMNVSNPNNPMYNSGHCENGKITLENGQLVVHNNKHSFACVYNGKWFFDKYAVMKYSEAVDKPNLVADFAAAAAAPHLCPPPPPPMMALNKPVRPPPEADVPAPPPMTALDELDDPTKIAIRALERMAEKRGYENMPFGKCGRCRLYGTQCCCKRTAPH